MDSEYIERRYVRRNQNMSKGISIRGDNTGLAVRINLWALKKYLDNFSSRKARLWIAGEVTNAETKKRKKFNDAGELISILGKWNVNKFKQLQRKAKAKAKVK
jgi:hypothetical protein